MDGHNIAKNSAITGTLSLVDGTQKSSNIRTIFMVKGVESYDNLKENNVWFEIQQLMPNFLDRAKFFFVADLKSLLQNLGFKAANAKDICIYCSCSKENWLRCGTSCKPRYKRDASGKYFLPKLKRTDPGYAREPLIESDKFEFVILDMLHLYLRVSDQILSRACSLMSSDGRAAFVEFCCKNGANRFKLVGRGDFQDVKISCLTGPNRKRILPLLRDSNVVKNFCGVDDAVAIAKLVGLFLDLIELFDDDQAVVNCADMPLKVQKIVAMFCATFSVTHIPDYVHLMLHLPFLVSNFGNLKRFKQEGVERHNKFVERKYFAQTKCSTDAALKASNRAFLY